MRLRVLVVAAAGLGLGLGLAGCSYGAVPPPRAPAGSPSPDAPFTWPQDMPPSCSEPQPEPRPGVLIGELLMDPADRLPGPWTGQTEFGGLCVWAEVGTVDYAARTVQLLMKDTNAGAQKAFTGHLGEVISVGRFTVKINPLDGRTAAAFEVDIYWAG